MLLQRRRVSGWAKWPKQDQKETFLGKNTCIPGEKVSLSAQDKLGWWHLSGNSPKSQRRNVSVLEKDQHAEKSRAERQRQKDPNDTAWVPGLVMQESRTLPRLPKLYALINLPFAYAGLSGGSVACNAESTDKYRSLSCSLQRELITLSFFPPFIGCGIFLHQHPEHFSTLYPNLFVHILPLPNYGLLKDKDLGWCMSKA